MKMMSVIFFVVFLFGVMYCYVRSRMAMKLRFQLAMKKINVVTVKLREMISITDGTLMCMSFFLLSLVGLFYILGLRYSYLDTRILYSLFITMLCDVCSLPLVECLYLPALRLSELESHMLYVSLCYVMFVILRVFIHLRFNIVFVGKLYVLIIAMLCNKRCR